MKICLIAAVAQNGVIGTGDRLPWRLPDDLRRFKQLTWGHPLILGRKTYESIGGPLPGRRMIVLTRQADYRSPSSVQVAGSLTEALDLCGPAPKAFIGGGSEVYRKALPIADRLYLTRVLAAVEGDRYFPEVDWSRWRLVQEEKHPADERHQFGFLFQEFGRREGG